MTSSQKSAMLQVKKEWGKVAKNGVKYRARLIIHITKFVYFLLFSKRILKFSISASEKSLNYSSGMRVCSLNFRKEIIAPYCKFYSKGVGKNDKSL